jgi:hypothetical protein
MLQVSLIVLLLRGIPEALLFVLGIYVISGANFSKYLYLESPSNEAAPKSKKHFGIKVNLYLLSSLIYLICVYLIRLLPINSGVHTLLAMLLMIIVSIKLMGIKFSKSIISVIITSIITIFSELINIIILQLIYGNSYNDLLKEPLNIAIYTTPSSIIMFIVIAIIYFTMRILNKKRKGKNGEVSTDNSKQNFKRA